MIDMYARTSGEHDTRGRFDAASIARLRADAEAAPQSLIVVSCPAARGSIAQRLSMLRAEARRDGTAVRTAGETAPGGSRQDCEWRRAYALPTADAYARSTVIPNMSGTPLSW